jgi:Domain of unknown function (DUF5925)/ATPase family associated with various cellular activities (AAA)
VSDLQDRLELTREIHPGGTAGALFVARVIDQGLTHLRTGSWATSARSLDAISDVLHRVSGEGSQHVLAQHDGTLTQASLLSGWVHVQVAGEDPERVGRALAELKELFPPPDPSSTHRVNVQFWTYGQHGPISSYREVSVPEWSDLEGNYTSATRARLEVLMREFKPAHGGQLILWHGEAGTGKTFALRALAWEWRDWCEFQYIVDPDSFFGEHADYLMSVLTQPGYAEMPDPRVMHRMMMSGGYVDVGRSPDEDVSKAWRLLILEDTGELLTPDAKSIIGQGLSRFLNVVDGLIGQGLRILVLVTTNEPMKALHPAVARPGRCAANIEFEPLSVEESNAWLERHDVEDRVARPTLLGDLYALEAGQPPGTMPPAGFAA